MSIPRIVNPSEINAEFNELMIQKPVEYTLGDSVLDQHLRVRMGQMNIILGHPQVGKTTWINWFLYKMAELHGLKSMIYSAENDVVEIYSQLAQLHSGKYYWNMSKQENIDAQNFIHDHFCFIDDTEIYTARQMLDRFDGYETNFYVIDPHNGLKVDSGDAYRDSVDLGMEIRAFVKRSKTTVFICAHPRSESQRRTHSDGDYKGMLMPPIGPDIEGGGTWKNKCDNLWVAHRYTNHPTDWKKTFVTVEKIRYQNTGAKPTMLNFPLVFYRDGVGFSYGELTFEQKIRNSDETPFLNDDDHVPF